jgi:dihydrofolate reductase
VITDVPGEQIEGCTMAYSIADAIDKMEADAENFIIGGGSVYTQFLPHADKLYLTLVNKDFEADVFFPVIDYSEWDVVSRTESTSDDLSYTFLDLQRKK